MKTCRTCQTPKELKQFHIDPTCKDGRKPDCKECRAERYKVKPKKEKKINLFAGEYMGYQ